MVTARFYDENGLMTNPNLAFDPFVEGIKEGSKSLEAVNNLMSFAIMGACIAIALGLLVSVAKESGQPRTCCNIYRLLTNDLESAMAGSR